MYRRVHIVWCLLLIFVITSDCGETSWRRNNDADEGRRYVDQSRSSQPPYETSSFDGSLNGGNQRRNQQSNSDSFGKLNKGDEYGRRPNQQEQGTSGSFSNKRESEFVQFPNSQHSSGSLSNNERPNQFSGSVLTSESSTNQHNHRPNQPSGSSSQFSNKQTNQQLSESNNNQGSGFIHRPKEELTFGSDQYGRPNQQSTFLSSSNNENQFNQSPSQQFGNNQRPIQQISGPSNEFGQNTNERPNQNRPSNQFNSEYFTGTERPLLPSKEPVDHINQGQSPQSLTTSDSGKEKPGQKELCYGIFGCFSVLEPWSSKLRPIPGPLPPDNNSATMYFYSRPNIQQRYLINLYPEFSLGESKFDSRRPTVIIVHGFIQDGNELWMEEMKNAYLKHVDANVMLVDWGKGARRLSYLQAAGNTRLIGTMIGHLIKRLMNSHNADPADFHLIGHSLGAQIASYAGKEVPGIGRITALDPAQPGFEGFDKLVRLDKSDALFVDVVHTNAKPFIPTLGLGMIKPYGHVDFYMNGGFDQPLCVSPPKNGIKEIKSILDLANLPLDWFSQTFFCDHARAHAYLTEAFNNTDCIFWGHKATAKNIAQGVVNTLTQGFLGKYVALSTSCSKDDCVPLGFLTQKSPLRGSFVVTTNGKFPYCRSEPGVPAESGPKNTKDSKNNF